MTWKAIQLWKNPNLVDDFMNAFTFLPFGREVRRGEVRSFGLSVASVWGIAVLICLALTDSTHQAYGAIRSLLIAGVRLRWKATTAADLYAELRPRPGHDGERELMDLARCPLLIIDDLGAAKNSEWTEEITMRLINRRYNEMLPTLVTTNLGMADLRQHIGDRVASRLTEMSDKVILDGPDPRRVPAAERRRTAV